MKNKSLSNTPKRRDFNKKGSENSTKNKNTII
jgi:hypothetical protein